MGKEKRGGWRSSVLEELPNGDTLGCVVAQGVVRVDQDGVPSEGGRRPDPVEWCGGIGRHEGAVQGEVHVCDPGIIRCHGFDGDRADDEVGGERKDRFAPKV